MRSGIIHNDHLATPQTMTDSTGTVVWAADYKPFGDATITVSTITNNLRFPGQYYDAETGLNYNYFRDYNPLIGRYVEADPIGIKHGENHLYLYAANNPIRNIDPLGEAVYNCVRDLSGLGSLATALHQYLGLGHNYLWVDSANNGLGLGYGLGPKGGYMKLAAALMGLTAAIDIVPGTIEHESNRTGSTCSLVTSDKCLEKKILNAILKEDAQSHMYSLKFYNCYNWVSHVLSL